VTVAPVVIEVRDLEKTFRVPTHRVDTLKERAVHPLTRAEFRELRALRCVSFDVRRGEFFGVVGRNGSGKSTLLKVLAGIYGADGGRVRMAGRLAPFIELGVGFNLDLTARENVALNGVMMGLGRREAVAKLDSVLDFAGLAEFVDLKLKNYSSGMLVRLAFAVMVEADSDIMLVDEVLAVGDASFAQKCMDVFRDKRRAGKTVVLVTHDMATVQAFCDRAMLMHDGEVRYLGDPEEAALRYYRLNFGGAEARENALRFVAAGATNVQEGHPIEFHLVVQARYGLRSLLFGFQVMNADGVPVFGFTKTLSNDQRGANRIAAGERIRVAGKIENGLLPGRYSIGCSIFRDSTQGDLALAIPQLAEFDVLPADVDEHEIGMVRVHANVDAVLER
jgi:ABC-type polysaccharide/polyol phosphate transport system ATPase subunit